MTKVISVQVSDDVAERVEQLREGEGYEKESRSQALKRVVRAGLDEQDRSIIDVHPLVAVSAAGWLLVGSAFGEASALAGAVGAVIALLPIIATLLPEHILDRL